MAAAEATVAAATNSTLVAAMTTAVMTATTTATLAVTAATATVLRVSCSQRAMLEITIPSKSHTIAVFICSARCSNKVSS
jgi:hypothetical protein